VTVEESSGDGVVPVREHVGLNGYAFSNRSFGRKAAAVDLRCDVLDDDPDFAHRGGAPE
jgi:hypothetical protein